MTIALVQQAGTSQGGGLHTLSQAYAGNVTAGNLLIAAVTKLVAADAQTITITDTQSNMWLTAVSIFQGADLNCRVTIFYVINSAGGATTVTAATGGGDVTAISLNVFEYSGATTTSPLDATASATRDALPNILIDPGNVTTAESGELLFSYVAYDNAFTVGGAVLTPGAGYTREFDSPVAGAGQKRTAAQDQVAGAAGSYSTAWAVTSVSAVWAGVAATFKAVATPPPASSSVEPWLRRRRRMGHRG